MKFIFHVFVKCGQQPLRVGRSLFRSCGQEIAAGTLHCLEGGRAHESSSLEGLLQVRAGRSSPGACQERTGCCFVYTTAQHLSSTDAAARRACSALLSVCLVTRLTEFSWIQQTRAAMRHSSHSCPNWKRFWKNHPLFQDSLKDERCESPGLGGHAQRSVSDTASLSVSNSPLAEDSQRLISDTSLSHVSNVPLAEDPHHSASNTALLEESKVPAGGLSQRAVPEAAPVGDPHLPREELSQCLASDAAPFGVSNSPLEKLTQCLVSDSAPFGYFKLATGRFYTVFGVSDCSFWWVKPTTNSVYSEFGLSCTSITSWGRVDKHRTISDGNFVLVSCQRRCSPSWVRPRVRVTCTSSGGVSNQGAPQSRTSWRRQISSFTATQERTAHRRTTASETTPRPVCNSRPGSFPIREIRGTISQAWCRKCGKGSLGDNSLCCSPRNKHSHGKAPRRKTQQLATTWRWTKGLNHSLKSSLHQEIPRLACGSTRNHLPRRPHPNDRFSQCTALRTVQQRSSEVFAPRFRFHGRDCRCSDSKPPHEQSLVHGNLQGDPFSCAPRAPKKTSPAHAYQYDSCIGESGGWLRSIPILQSFCMVAAAPKLAHTSFQWPQEHNPFGSHPTARLDCFSAKLTRSKTLGADQELQSRPVVIDSACFVVEETWMKQGWGLLQTLADFSRDYLMPCPSSGYLSCIKKELRYDTVFAVQHRVLSTLSQARTNARSSHTSILDTTLWKNISPKCNSGLGYRQSWTRLLRRLVSTGQRQVCKSRKMSHQKLAEVSS